MLHEQIYRKPLDFETVVKSFWLAKIMEFQPGRSTPNFNHIDQIFYFDDGASQFHRRLVESYAQLRNKQVVTIDFTTKSLNESQIIYMPNFGRAASPEHVKQYNYARTIAEAENAQAYFSPKFTSLLHTPWPSDTLL